MVNSQHPGCNRKKTDLLHFFCSERKWRVVARLDRSRERRGPLRGRREDPGQKFRKKQLTDRGAWSNNENAMGGVRYLALVCSLFLALPSGWCRTAGIGNCCTPNESVQVQTQIPPVPLSCCCDTEAGTTSPTETCKANTEPAAPHPNLPSHCCCRDRQPTTLPDPTRLPVERHPASLVPLPVSIHLTGCQWGAIFSTIRSYNASFLAIHILHCVWLC